MDEHQAQQEQEGVPASPEEEPLPGQTEVAEEDFTDSQTADVHEEMDNAENDAPPAPAAPVQAVPADLEPQPQAEEADLRPPHEREQAQQQEQEQSQESGLQAPRPDQNDADNPL